MPTNLYDKGREGFLAGDIDWDANDIRVILVDTAAYTVDLTNHDNLDDIPAGARVKVSGALTGKAVTAGVASAAATLAFTAVTGASIEAIVIYKHTGVESTSRLIAYIDVFSPSQITPNGNDITLTWDTGVNKIFKI